MDVSPDKFWPRVHKSDGCWLWTGSRHYGYGVLFRPRPGKPGDTIEVRAHRVAYELIVGPIPDGLELDHTCHNADLACRGGPNCPHRACVNPSHLEAVSNLQNVARGRVGTGPQGLTHCKRGHEYTPENSYLTSQGRRACRICHRHANRERMAARRARKKQEVRTTNPTA